MDRLKRFFGPVEGSLKGVIIPEELYRAMLTSLGSGSLLGIVAIILTGILSHASLIFPNPTVAALATSIIALILDLLRRQSQGEAMQPNQTSTLEVPTNVQVKDQ